MSYRGKLASLALAATLLVGGAGSVAAGPENGVPNNCFGQHVSDMARMHGGIAAATSEHHPDMTVGEHMAMMREHGCDHTHEH